MPNQQSKAASGYAKTRVKTAVATPTPVVTTPKQPAPPATFNTDQPKPSAPTETWEQQEARDFAYADIRGWTSLTSTNSLGEKRYNGLGKIDS
ncbi:MAG: hypothetical protein HY007_01705 [Candidatus Sungbacteria bacterium]|nr:hypothetical protein [Candidatus Sungbacteria bacterium]